MPKQLPCTPMNIRTLTVMALGACCLSITANTHAADSLPTASYFGLDTMAPDSHRRLPKDQNSAPRAITLVNGSG